MPTIPTALKALSSLIPSTGRAQMAQPATLAAPVPRKAGLWFEWMVEDLSALIRRGLEETPPLDHSYFMQCR